MTATETIIKFSKVYLSDSWSGAREEAQAGVDGMVECMMDEILDMLELDPRGLHDVEYEINLELQDELQQLLWDELYPDECVVEDEDEDVQPTDMQPTRKVCLTTKQLHDWQKPEDYDF